MYSWDTLQDLIFLHFMLASSTKATFWDPFKIQRVSKRHPKSAKFRPFVKKLHDFFRRWRVLFATCFSKALRAPPLVILDRFRLAFDSLFDRFRLPVVLYRFHLGTFQGGKSFYNTPTSHGRRGEVHQVYASIYGFEMFLSCRLGIHTHAERNRRN
jgi:hypothetical protein